MIVEGKHDKIYVQILHKIEGKNRGRVRKNRIFEFLNSGGGGAVCQKCTSFLGGFVESVLCRQRGKEGQKSPKMCVCTSFMDAPK